MKITKIYLLLFLQLMLVSCFRPAQYSDVSSDPIYSEVIGKSYRVREDLKIHGITNDSNYKKVVSYYVVMAKPGISGPEVVSSGIVKMGTLLTVDKALQCGFCPFDNGLAYEVVVENESKYVGSKVMIKAIGGTNFVEDINGQYLLNPKYFD